MPTAVPNQCYCLVWGRFFAKWVTTRLLISYVVFLSSQEDIKHRWKVANKRVYSYNLLFVTSIHVVVLCLPDKWPYLQQYSQNRTKHIAVVLSDAVCELFYCEGWHSCTVCSSHVFLCAEALMIKELWHASCSGFWTSLICWHCSDPLPVSGFLMLARRISVTLFCVSPRRWRGVIVGHVE